MSAAQGGRDAALPFGLELIDLDTHADGSLLRLIAEATKAREAYALLTERPYRRGKAKADRGELSAAYTRIFQLEMQITAVPAKSGAGLLSKALFALEHGDVTRPHAANLTWGIGGLLFSTVNDAVRMGAFA